MRACLADACRMPLERLRPDTPMVELLDSLTLVSVLTRIEMAYDVELTLADRLAALEADTLAELVDGIRRGLDAARPSA